jgi:hypothetical protein
LVKIIIEPHKRTTGYNALTCVGENRFESLEVKLALQKSV